MVGVGEERRVGRKVGERSLRWEGREESADMMSAREGREDGEAKEAPKEGRGSEAEEKKNPGVGEKERREEADKNDDEES